MAFDAFLKLDGIDGESTDKVHEGEIEIMSFSWGEAQTGISATGGGGGAGKVSMQDIHFSARTSKASPNLFQKCATGEHIQTGLLTVRKAGGGRNNALEYLKIKLVDVLVSSYAIGTHPSESDSDSDPPDPDFSLLSGNGDTPTDHFSLNFAKIEFDYTSPDGTLTSAFWDQQQNTTS